MVPRTKPIKLALYKRVERAWITLRLTNADTLQTDVDGSISNVSKITLKKSCDDEDKSQCEEKVGGEILSQNRKSYFIVIHKNPPFKLTGIESV